MMPIVTALFASTEAAGRGAAALHALGVAAERIALREQPAQGVPPASPDAPGGEPGLPGLLDALFVPAKDLAAHREAMRRGQILLSVELEEEGIEAAREALDEAGALDIEEPPEG